MPYSSTAIANRFIELAAANGQKLTNMQLQKLVFLAQGITLAIVGEPLTYHNVHAWQWGPVFPKLYKRFSAYGASPIDATASCDDVIDPSNNEDPIIVSVWENFGELSGPKLSALTHEPGSPWDVTWKSKQYGVIPTDLIADFYRKQLNAAPPQETTAG